MAQYLSDQWFDEMQAATAGLTIEASSAMSLREVIHTTPFGEVQYVLRLENGAVALERHSEEADVTFTQSYETAVALHKGELTIHDAFFAGTVKVNGKLNALLEHSDLLQGLAEPFAQVRSTTTY